MAKYTKAITASVMASMLMMPHAMAADGTLAAGKPAGVKSAQGKYGPGHWIVPAIGVIGIVGGIALSVGGKPTNNLCGTQATCAATVTATSNTSAR